MADAEQPRDEASAEQPAPPDETRAKKKKKRGEKEEAKPLPGAGTPDGDKLRAAFRAFDVGDYARVRALLPELERAEDPAIRDTAADLRARISIDPVQIVVVVACALVLVAIAYTWVF